jgi:hypothetical protein
MPVVPIALTAAIFIRPVAAQDVDAKGGKELTELGQKIDKAANRAGPEQVVDKIVREFKGTFTESDVQGLRQKGLGFGEITIVLALASKTGMTSSQILALRKPGEGWGELARDLKLKNLGSVIKSVKATEKDVDRAALDRSDKPTDRLETATKPERMDRPERPMRPEKPGR